MKDSVPSYNNLEEPAFVVEVSLKPTMLNVSSMTVICWQSHANPFQTEWGALDFKGL